MVKDLVLLWLWCRLAAASLSWPLAWELPSAKSAALKRQTNKQTPLNRFNRGESQIRYTKKKKKKDRNEYGHVTPFLWHSKTGKLIHTDNKQINDCLGLGAQWVSDWEKIPGNFLGWWKCSCLTMVLVTRVYTSAKTYCTLEVYTHLRSVHYTIYKLHFNFFKNKAAPSIYPTKKWVNHDVTTQ